MRAPTGAVTGTIADSKKDAKTPKLVSSESTTDSAHGVHNLREATIDLTAKTYNTVLVAKAAGSAQEVDFSQEQVAAKTKFGRCPITSWSLV